MIKYKKILRDLEQKIESGFYQKNQKLPTELELCEQYDVSKTTIKRVMTQLTEQGYIYRRRGDGSYVNDLEENEYLRREINKQFGGFTNVNDGEKIETKLLEFSFVNPSELICKKLKLEPDTYVYYIKRLRIQDNIPRVIEHAYITIEIIPGLTPNIAQNSIHRYIEDELKLKIKSAHRKIKAKVATSEQCKLLEMQEPQAILEYEQVVYLDTGMPFQFSISENRGDLSEMINVLTR